MWVDRTCSIEGCSKLHEARGFCGAHYFLWRKYGDPLGAPKVSAPELDFDPFLPDPYLVLPARPPRTDGMIHEGGPGMGCRYRCSRCGWLGRLQNRCDEAARRACRHICPDVPVLRAKLVDLVVKAGAPLEPATKMAIRIRKPYQLLEEIAHWEEVGGQSA